MLPSTPLSGGDSELRPGSTVDGETGDLPKSKGEAESSILWALGLRGARGEPACKAMQNKVEEQTIKKRLLRPAQQTLLWFYGEYAKITKENIPESR